MPHFSCYYDSVEMKEILLSPILIGRGFVIIKIPIMKGENSMGNFFAANGLFLILVGLTIFYILKWTLKDTEKKKYENIIDTWILIIKIFLNLYLIITTYFAFLKPEVFSFTVFAITVVIATQEILTLINDEIFEKKK